MVAGNDESGEKKKPGKVNISPGVLAALTGGVAAAKPKQPITSGKKVDIPEGLAGLFGGGAPRPALQVTSVAPAVSAEENVAEQRAVFEALEKWYRQAIEQTTRMQAELEQDRKENEQVQRDIQLGLLGAREAAAAQKILFVQKAALNGSQEALDRNRKANDAILSAGLSDLASRVKNMELKKAIVARQKDLTENVTAEHLAVYKGIIQDTVDANNQFAKTIICSNPDFV